MYRSRFVFCKSKMSFSWTFDLQELRIFAPLRSKLYLQNLTKHRQFLSKARSTVAKVDYIPQFVLRRILSIVCQISPKIVGFLKHLLTSHIFPQMFNVCFMFSLNDLSYGASLASGLARVRFYISIFLFLWTFSKYCFLRPGRKARPSLGLLA